MSEKTIVVPTERPKYEAPRIQQMTEKEILSAFQVTQSMASWWVSSAC